LKDRPRGRLALRMGGGLGRLGKHSILLELKLSWGNAFV